MTAKIFFTVISFLFLTASLSAQSGWQKLPCESVNNAGVVFVGEAVRTRIDRVAKEQEQFSADFVVREPFIGSTSGEKITAVGSLETGEYAGVTTGGVYLVYAG